MECIMHPAVSAKEWNEFVARNGGGFLQSFEWARFQEQYGIRTMRVMIKEGGAPVLCATVLRRPLPLKKEFWYVPFGPVLATGASAPCDIFRFFISALRSHAPKNTVFLKVEPDATWREISFSDEGFVRGSDIQVSRTIIVDCAAPERDMLAHMKQKTRYNIGLAARHGVKVVGTNDHIAPDRSIFFSLLEETAARQRFRLHPRRYYETMMDCFLGKEPEEEMLAQKLFFAQHDGRVIACALVGFFGGRATYLHGASADEHKNVMAPYLLHWEIMRYAKSIGCKEYDLWGVFADASSRGKKGAGEGFSRFKSGFGGEVIAYPGAHDLPLDTLWYTVYRIGKTLAR